MEEAHLSSVQSSLMEELVDIEMALAKLEKRLEALERAEDRSIIQISLIQSGIDELALLLEMLRKLKGEEGGEKT